MSQSFEPHWYQYPPADPFWTTWVLAAPRGAGRTRIGAELMIEAARTPGTKLLIVGPSAQETRESMIEGPSGILFNADPDNEIQYFPSTRRLDFENGSRAFFTTAQEPDTTRGVQAHYTWGQDVERWPVKHDSGGLTILENITLATRLGDYPRVFYTMMPRLTDPATYKNDFQRVLYENAYADPKHTRFTHTH